MIWSDFVLRLILAFILGAGIGIERQWTKTRSVLKTNVLVSIGAAMFVMMAAMTPNDTSPTRVAAQVVSGIGFLGGGVILREGRSVRGINTAATLWCAGAIGTLTGSGFFVPAYFGTLAVIGANLMLRPVVQIFQPQFEKPDKPEKPDKDKPDKIENKTQDSPAIASQKTPEVTPSVPETLSHKSRNDKIRYRCQLNCQPKSEADTLALLMQSIEERNLELVAMQSKNINDENQQWVEIKAEFLSSNSELELLKQLIALLQDKEQVHTISWESIAHQESLSKNN